MKKPNKMPPRQVRLEPTQVKSDVVLPQLPPVESGKGITEGYGEGVTTQTEVDGMIRATMADFKANITYEIAIPIGSVNVGTPEAPVLEKAYQMKKKYADEKLLSSALDEYENYVRAGNAFNVTGGVEPPSGGGAGVSDDTNVIIKINNAPLGGLNYLTALVNGRKINNSTFKSEVVGSAFSFTANSLTEQQYPPIEEYDLVGAELMLVSWVKNGTAKWTIKVTIPYKSDVPEIIINLVPKTFLKVVAEVGDDGGNCALAFIESGNVGRIVAVGSVWAHTKTGFIPLPPSNAIEVYGLSRKGGLITQPGVFTMRMEDTMSNPVAMTEIAVPSTINIPSNIRELFFSQKRLEYVNQIAGSGGKILVADPQYESDGFSYGTIESFGSLGAQPIKYQRSAKTTLRVITLDPLLLPFNLSFCNAGLLINTVSVTTQDFIATALDEHWDLLLFGNAVNPYPVPTIFDVLYYPTSQELCSQVPMKVYAAPGTVWAQNINVFRNPGLTDKAGFTGYIIPYPTEGQIRRYMFSGQLQTGYGKCGVGKQIVVNNNCDVSVTIRSDIGQYSLAPRTQNNVMQINEADELKNETYDPSLTMTVKFSFLKDDVTLAPLESPNPHELPSGVGVAGNSHVLNADITDLNIINLELGVPLPITQRIKYGDTQKSFPFIAADELTVDPLLGQIVDLCKVDAAEGVTQLPISFVLPYLGLGVTAAEEYQWPSLPLASSTLEGDKWRVTTGNMSTTSVKDFVIGPPASTFGSRSGHWVKVADTEEGLAAAPVTMAFATVPYALLQDRLALYPDRTVTGGTHYVSKWIHDLRQDKIFLMSAVGDIPAGTYPTADAEDDAALLDKLVEKELAKKTKTKKK